MKHYKEIISIAEQVVTVWNRRNLSCHLHFSHFEKWDH